MVIHVPVIADVDVIVAGGSVKAVRAAAALAKNNVSVFAAMPRNYCGDDPGSTLDFHAAVPDLELFPRFPKLLPRPMEVKRLLERQLVEAALNPDPITERMIDEGPTKGTTFKSLRWAIATTSAPGSATAGHPASEITPIDSPACKGFR